MHRPIIYIIWLGSLSLSYSQGQIVPKVPIWNTSNPDSIPYHEIKEADYVVPIKFEKGFKEIYKKDASFIYDETPKEGLWKRFKNWVKYLLERLFQNTRIGRDGQNTIRTLLKIGSYLVVAVLLFYLIRAFVQKDLYWLVAKSKKKNSPTTYDKVEEDLKNTNFEELLQEVRQKKEFRLAVRYYYLWTLQLLSDKGHIEWELEKTNTDYIYELQNSELKEKFRYLSYVYNNIWYGEFEIDQSLFTEVQTSFLKLINSLENE